MRIVILVVMLGVCGASGAEIIVPQDYGSINEALGNVAPGDTVTILQGLYYESSLPLPSEVLIRGATGNPRDVVIDGDGSGPIFFDTDGATGTEVRALTIQNGAALAGGAMRLQQVSGVVIRDCVFLSNHASAQGGAVHVVPAETPAAGADVLLVGCKFTGNEADTDGGAIHVNGDLDIRDCIWTGNTAVGRGGAIFHVGPKCRIVGSTFASNQADSGGAVCFLMSVAGMEHCILERNTAALRGGAIYTENGSVEGRSLQFHDNTCGETGGAVYTAASTYVDCEFRNNESLLDGGAARLRTAIDCGFHDNAAGRDGGAVFGPASAERCMFAGNDAGRDGGGIQRPTRVLDCEFIGNTAGRYGGGAVVWFYDSVFGSTFDSNHAIRGGGAYVLPGIVVHSDYRDCIFRDNTALEAGGGLDCSTDVVLYDCRFMGNDAPLGPAGTARDLTIDCSDTMPERWEAVSVTVIETDCGTSNESMSFGRLKNLYR